MALLRIRSSANHPRTLVKMPFTALATVARRSAHSIIPIPAAYRRDEMDLGVGLQRFQQPQVFGLAVDRRNNLRPNPSRIVRQSFLHARVRCFQVLQQFAEVLPLHAYLRRPGC